MQGIRCPASRLSSGLFFEGSNQGEEFPRIGYGNLILKGRHAGFSVISRNSKQEVFEQPVLRKIRLNFRIGVVLDVQFLALLGISAAIWAVSTRALLVPDLLGRGRHKGHWA